MYYWIKDIENGNLLAENIISFIRAIFSNSSDVMLMHGFNKNIAIKYFEIKDIMWNFEFPKNNKKRNIVKNLYEKIDEKYDYVPLLLKKNPNFEEDTTDAKEKKIWESIWGSKKNN